MQSVHVFRNHVQDVDTRAAGSAIHQLIPVEPVCSLSVTLQGVKALLPMLRSAEMHAGLQLPLHTVLLQLSVAEKAFSHVITGISTTVCISQSCSIKQVYSTLA
jgi:hypothetical protein